jgi:hypothetical protein
MSEAVVQGPAPEIAMDNNPSPEADKTPEASPDAPFTRFTHGQRTVGSSQTRRIDARRLRIRSDGPGGTP